LAIPPLERAKHGVCSGENCEIDEGQFFLHGLVRIPVIDADATLNDIFEWGVWASLGRDDYLRALDVWNRPGRESEPPRRAELANDLPQYTSTLGLIGDLVTRGVGLRPLFILRDGTHPLIKEQKTGVTLARLAEITAALHAMD
jgi:hypothetical protein